METVVSSIYNGLGDIRQQAFPYGVRLVYRGEDKAFPQYEVFNRQYERIGTPFIFERKSKEFTPSKGRPVLFYKDATNPVVSKKNMTAYLKTMERFMKQGVRYCSADVEWR
jgi:hypothetical protein